MSLRIAIIDLGTNTFNLLIAEQKNGKPEIVFATKIAARLGMGGMKDQRISPSAITRGVEAMIEHQKTAEKFGCTKIVAFATSMVRDASNGMEFKEEVKQKTGIEIEIISGDREAELIYKGVQLIMPTEGKFLIMDIGGGSTEFIIADHKTIFWKKSYPLGVTRLYEVFPHSDPILKNEITSFQNHFESVLTELTEQCKIHQIESIIGSAGSFETFASMANFKIHNKDYDHALHFFQVPLQDCIQLFEELICSNHEQRVHLPGLIELRRDLIVVSSLLTRYVVRKNAIQSLYISTYALKEGVLSELSEQ